ncbi:uncharacterized protein PAN0_002c0951 [Moesziomyces antarcticus]|uniref:uncharacterized protein n=1 Tax=Pseudozyma antarctica TaxID=84753 RepID=UPI00071977CF|nr:uncharacterized protein PAN0_002c0951 [Moesziomyces antarcticus]GAK62749.1 hypothetical protein PAN0_002c0951 [Moesziomyces antarcticus]
MKTQAGLAVLAVAVLASGCSAEATREVAGSRDLFDQMVHSLASKWMPGYRGDGLQWSVHPLPRNVKRQNSASPMVLQPAGDEEEQGLGSLAGLFGGGSASVLAASPSRSATQASATDSASASPASSAASSAATPSADRSVSSTPATSSVPTAPAFSFSTPSPSASSPSSSVSSTGSARPTMSAQKDDDAPPPSLLSPKHKFFPLVVAGIAAAGLLALMLLIAIARAVAHDQLRRDKLKQSYGFDEYSDKPGKTGDKFTSNPEVGAARSLRRAMTRKKLGSFARRTADGSVLIEVGDEVFAVPPHLADSYRDRILREKRSRSDLSQEGLFGNVQPRHLNDGGPDADGSTARAAYDTMLGDKPSRSLSQRLTDRFKAITTSPKPMGAYSFDARDKGAVRQVDLARPTLTKGGAEWSIQPQPQPQLQPQPEYGTARVVERTSARPPPPRDTSKPVTRKAPPKLELSTLTAKLQDLEKQSNVSSSSGHSRRLPAEASLSRSAASSASANGTFGGSGSGSDLEAGLPGAFPERSKSLARARSVKPLILSTTERVGGYRHRHPDAHRSRTQVRPNKPLERKSTVALASPTRFSHDKNPALVVHPEKPQAAFRPLPVPPPFTLPK